MRVPKNILISITVASALAGMTGGANADLVISKKPTSNMNCSGGICNATAADAVLNVKDLAKMLAKSDVHVFAEGAATDITVADPFSWTSSHQLTLGAYGSLNVKAAITVAGTSGLTITTNVAQTGGLFRLVNVGKISLWDTNSVLVINNTTYTLVNNLPTLISAIAANPSGVYALAKDYNAAQDGSYLLSPISTTFNGVLEGLGNAINGLSIYNSDAGETGISLFAQVGSTGQLSDVNLTNVSMQAGGAFLSPLVFNNSGTVAHCSAAGTLSGLGGAYSLAGLVSWNIGTVTRSRSNINMDGNAGAAGGLVASDSGTISLSVASGSTKAINLAGGLVANESGTIIDSSAQGDVSVSSGEDAAAGGLVGELSNGSIQTSFATGAVQGGTDGPKKLIILHKLPFKTPGNAVGGLVGISAGAIGYAYATGSVSQGASQGEKLPSVGGLVGQAADFDRGSTIFQAYALGRLSLSGKKFIGGVIGADHSAPDSNDDGFWDFDTTGVDNPYRGAGNRIKDAGLKGFGDTKFRTAIMSKLDDRVWAEDPKINNGYPYLIGNPPPPQ